MKRIMITRCITVDICTDNIRDTMLYNNIKKLNEYKVHVIPKLILIKFVLAYFYLIV